MRGKATVTFNSAISLIAAKYERLFWEKVDKGSDDECWNWTGAVGTQGYGRHSVGNVDLVTHRTAYELLVGPIQEDGFIMAHKCSNSLCVNPRHLEITDQANLQRLVAKVKTNA